MKGKLTKTADNEWTVAYWSDSEECTKVVPLHPTDVKDISSWSRIFDNVEARIEADPWIKFTMVEVCQNYNGAHTDKDCSCKSNFKEFAKWELE